MSDKRQIKKPFRCEECGKPISAKTREQYSYFCKTCAEGKILKGKEPKEKVKFT